MAYKFLKWIKSLALNLNISWLFNICLISQSVCVSDQATKIIALNTEKT